MKIDVRFRGLEPSARLRDHALRRIRFHLSRFGKEVRAVVVRLGDVNGPRGGVDKHCRITVSGRRFGSSTLDELDGDAYAAVDLATGRIARAIRRQLQRVRQLDPGGPSSRGVS